MPELLAVPGLGTEEGRREQNRDVTCPGYQVKSPWASWILQLHSEMLTEE